MLLCSLVENHNYFRSLWMKGNRDNGNPQQTCMRIMDVSMLLTISGRTILLESILLSWRLAWSGLIKTITSTIHDISFVSWSWLELIVVLLWNLYDVSRFSSAIQLNEIVVINQIFSWTRNVKLSSFPVQTEILFRMETHAISDYCSFSKYFMIYKITC